MSRSLVTHAARDGVHVLRYVGRVTYMSAPAIQRFMDDLLDRVDVSGLVFDLTEADALDSTNLGLLARINERLRDAGIAESTIVSLNDDINDVLFSMGFDQSFEIVTELPEQPPADDDTIDTEDGHDGANSPSSSELRRTVLEAHRALVRMSEAGRDEFQQVVAALEAENATRH